MRNLFKCKPLVNVTTQHESPLHAGPTTILRNVDFLHAALYTDGESSTLV